MLLRDLIRAFDGDGLSEQLYVSTLLLIESTLGSAPAKVFADNIDATDGGFYSEEGVDLFKMVMAEALEQDGAGLEYDNDGQELLYLGIDNNGKRI